MTAIVNDLTITITGTLDGFVPVDVSAVVTMVPLPKPPEPTLPPDPGPTPRGLSVLIAYGGAEHDFAEAGGIDRGDWTDARGAFVQGRVDVSNSALPAFVVQFRCDKTSSRVEVVFELGDTTPGVAAFNMTGYTATICAGADVLAVIEVAEHYWYSRWRWQSEPRPITGRIEDLQAAGLLPRFDVALGTTRPMSPDRVYTPMGLAGLTAYGPTTGERDEIGLVTESQAEYLRGESLPGSLFAQAEASGTLPWHYRNETDGAVYDFKSHGQASVYYPATIPTCGSPVQCDTAHEPPLAYVPYLLTRDPYYLEELQFAATFNVLCGVPAQRGNFCIGFAVRAHAWALRVLAQCATVTPDDAPGWVQSRSYWKQWLDQEREWMLTRYVNATAPPFTELPYLTFNFMASADGSPATTTLPASTYNSPWMEDYEAATLGHVVQMGHEDWRPILEWKMANTIARTDGKSGWVRARTTPYTLMLRAAEDAPYVEDWAAAWELNAATQPGMGDVDDPDTIPADASLTYASYTLSALALAAALDVAGAADCHAWLYGQIAANSSAKTYIDRKWTFAP